MNLTESTTAILASVEKSSGSAVVLEHDPSLTTLTRVVRASKGIDFHQIYYRSEGTDMNYLISYQASFLVRLFSLPPRERWQLVSTDEEKKNAIKGLGLDDYTQSIAHSLVDSLLIQLRSSILGLQIDGWIINNCPDLLTGQKSSVSGQLKDNLNALSPEVRDQYPRSLVDPNTAMNGVYAKFWGENLNDPRQLIPFVSLGYTDLVNKLYDVFLDTGDHPANDRAIINQWAKILNLDAYCHTETIPS